MLSCMYIHMYVNSFKYMYTSISTYKLMYSYNFIYAFMNMCIYIYIHKYTYIYVFIYTCIYYNIDPAKDMLNLFDPLFDEKEENSVNIKWDTSAEFQVYFGIYMH
jgi:hypothetical protein